MVGLSSLSRRPPTLRLSLPPNGEPRTPSRRVLPPDRRYRQCIVNVWLQFSGTCWVRWPGSVFCLSSPARPSVSTVATVVVAPRPTAPYRLSSRPRRQRPTSGRPSMVVKARWSTPAASAASSTVTVNRRGRQPTTMTSSTDQRARWPGITE